MALSFGIQVWVCYHGAQDFFLSPAAFGFLLLRCAEESRLLFVLMQEQSASISPLFQGQIFCVYDMAQQQTRSAHVRETGSVGLSLFSCQDTFCKEFWKILVVGTRFMQHATFYETTTDTLRVALEHSWSEGLLHQDTFIGAQNAKRTMKSTIITAHTFIMVILGCISRLHCSSY